MKRKISDILGIKYPVLQGGMAWISDYRLASAVSNAGGLGIIAAANAPAVWLKEQIKRAREKTDKPFAVNVMMFSPYIDEITQVIVEEKIKIITTGAGSPKKYMEMWKAAGVKVMPVIASTDMAKKAEDLGASAVIAEGCESGGHIGKLTTMALIPQVADAVKIPVIAAGGIADARGIAASFMLGASGVQMGTRFICTKECSAHKAYKDAILNAVDTSTVVTGHFIGKPVRSLENPMTGLYRQLEREGVTCEELEAFTLGSLKKATVDGNVTEGSVMAGQILGMIKDEPSCKELLNKLAAETDKLIGGVL